MRALFPRGRLLLPADYSLHGCNDGRGIVADPIFEHRYHVLYVVDVLRRVAVNEHEIGILADGDRTNRLVASERFRAVERGHLNRLFGRQSALHEQLDIALVAEPGGCRAVTG